MRMNLFAKEENLRYTGTFVRYGCLHKYGIRLTTVLIRNIKSNNELVADHQWFKIDQGFDQLLLQSGDVVSFDADVAAYIKGYKGKNKQLKKEKNIELDYRLTNITNVSVIKNQEKNGLWQEVR